MKIRLTKSEGGSDGKEGAKKLEIMTIQEYGNMKKKKKTDEDWRRRRRRRRRRCDNWRG